MKKCYTFDYSGSGKNNNTNKNTNNFDKNESDLIPGKHIIRNLINFSMSLGVLNTMTIGTFSIVNN